MKDEDRYTVIHECDKHGVHLQIKRPDIHTTMRCQCGSGYFGVLGVPGTGSMLATLCAGCGAEFHFADGTRMKEAPMTEEEHTLNMLPTDGQPN